MEDVFNPLYWKERYDNRGDEIHRSIFHGPLVMWDEIQEKNRQHVYNLVKPGDYILDAGCGYGRLLDIVPEHWEGNYLGIDFSPELIDEAKKRHSNRNFLCFDLRNLRDLEFPNNHFDLCIAMTMKNMIIRNVGQEAWDEIEKELTRISRRFYAVSIGKHD